MLNPDRGRRLAHVPYLSQVVVPAGDTTSKEVQVAVSDDYVGLSSPFTTVSVARVGACENNVDASPFVCGGVHVEGLGQTGVCLQTTRLRLRNEAALISRLFPRPSFLIL